MLRHRASLSIEERDTGHQVTKVQEFIHLLMGYCRSICGSAQRPASNRTDTEKHAQKMTLRLRRKALEVDRDERSSSRVLPLTCSIVLLTVQWRDWSGHKTHSSHQVMTPNQGTLLINRINLFLRCQFINRGDQPIQGPVVSRFEQLTFAAGL